MRLSGSLAAGGIGGAVFRPKEGTRGPRRHTQKILASGVLVAISAPDRPTDAVLAGTRLAAVGQGRRQGVDALIRMRRDEAVQRPLARRVTRETDKPEVAALERWPLSA